ncbi:MAG TPA: hypothetical protein VIP75_03825 [Acidothermales bacterium]
MFGIVGVARIAVSGDLVTTGVAPVFIPLFIRLDVAPQTLLAPTGSATPR